jgi:hypothetical protein
VEDQDVSSESFNKTHKGLEIILLNLILLNKVQVIITSFKLLRNYHFAIIRELTQNLPHLYVLPIGGNKARVQFVLFVFFKQVLDEDAVLEEEGEGCIEELFCIGLFGCFFPEPLVLEF